MRRLVPSLLLLSVAACQAGDGTVSSPAGTATTPPPEATSTAIAPTTTPTTSVPPTVPSGYTLSDCDTPPVPFAVLCDVHELLEENHVDSPLDPSTLAAGAALGVEGYEGTGGGDAGTFVCAIPDPAFESVCQALERRTGGDPEAIEAAVEEGVAAMISLSLDPFTYYIPPELSGALTEDGIVGAVGLLITIRDPAGSVCTLVEDPCRLEVDMALVEGPAFQAGLRAGDVILSVDGESVQGSALVDVAGMLDGPEGSEVTVEVADGGGDSTAVVIDRAPAAVPELEAELPRPDVGYIRLPDFGMDVPAFLHTVLETWTQQGISHLVVDLRNNPGGFVDVATLVASEFLADGLVLRSESPSERLEYPVQEGGVASSGPAVTVVVNSGSASASEIVAAVLQERDRATIAGEPTFGKNTVQIGFPLRNDGELRVTVARWVTPDGASVAGDGLAPDVAMEIPPDATPAEIVDLVLG